MLAAGRVRLKKKKNEEKKYGKIASPTPNTPRKPQQPGDRVQLETACEGKRHTR